MNVIRESILIDLKHNNYTDFAEHKDLIGFSICSECFEDEEVGRVADFSELNVIVEKNWLFNKMEKEGIDNPRQFLQNEYTSDDSYSWYEDAMLARKIVMIAFN